MKMLLTQPTVQVLALYMSYNYGMLYLVLSTFAALWELKYKEKLEIVGCNYVALAIGFAIGTQFCTWTQPKVGDYAPGSYILLIISSTDIQSTQIT